MATTSGPTPLEFEVGSALFYVVVGIGSIQTLLVITCIGILCLSMVCVCLQQHCATTAFNLENHETHNSKDMTTLSEEGRKTADVSTALMNSQMQCYKLEENPAYTIRQDLFNCKDNSAYTLEATCQGGPIYHEIQTKVEVPEKSTRVSDTTTLELAMQ